MPGTLPLTPENWLIRDEAFEAQMALRDRLIADRPGEVHTLLPSALPAARECYNAVLSTLRSDRGYQFGAGEVRRPDGVTVPLDGA
ncbi:MAG: heme-dependent oxidative N-demethylase subunit alpha family protein, partial [Pseudomonadota bacterium]